MRGFTLLEVIITIIIIGIVSTFGIAQYIVSWEKALDKEAIANLRLILAAERIYRMETPPYDKYCAATGTAKVNAKLKLLLPEKEATWSYRIKTYDNDTKFCAEARRSRGTVRRWRIKDPASAKTADPEPETGQCS